MRRNTGNTSSSGEERTISLVNGVGRDIEGRTRQLSLLTPLVSLTHPELKVKLL